MFSKKEIDDILQIAKKAGDILIKYYHQHDFSIIQKDDKSFVTQADIEANNLIISELKKIFPDIAIVSEENPEIENLRAAKNQKYFLIDPLDGTDGFIKKSDQFTVNIALIKNHHAIFGVIYLPATDIMYFNGHDNFAYKISNFSNKKDSNLQKINVTKNQNNLTVICTKREPEKSEIIAHLKQKNLDVRNFITISSSYKFCLIADGSADLYIRKASIKAWDIGAGHAIVKAAKGNVYDFNSKEIIYNFMENFNLPFFEVY